MQSTRREQRPRNNRRFLNAAAVVDEEDNADDDTTTTMSAQPSRTFDNASNNKTSRQTSVTASPFNDVPITNYQSNYTFGYLWFTQYMRSTLGWIGFASFILLILNFWVFFLWAIDRIPTVYYSFLYYGVIWYIYFVFVGVTTLVVSFSIDKTMHLLSTFFVLFALFSSLFILAAIFYQAYSCYTGQVDSMCADFYLTQFVLFGLTLFMAIDLLVLLILFVIVLMREKDSFSSIDPNVRM